jgi:hypothetical protein
LAQNAKTSAAPLGGFPLDGLTPRVADISVVARSALVGICFVPVASRGRDNPKLGVCGGGVEKHRHHAASTPSRRRRSTSSTLMSVLPNIFVVLTAPLSSSL